MPVASEKITSSLGLFSRRSAKGKEERQDSPSSHANPPKKGGKH